MIPSSKDIRQQFIDFFKGKGHKEVSSSPVIPFDDPTLLFTNAGMNQFKSIFLGQQTPSFLRVVNSQKCIRAGGKHNDLEEVGKDGYHHTFFEMLGNWSFGDYYKEEAIKWAWELLTEIWKLPKDKLYATVHNTDEEAYQLWKNITDIKPTHISYHGDKDNFWEMGETGPCGPCSEIHIDRGIEFCQKRNISSHTCKVNGDCSRFIELWNLVFIQYNRIENGELIPLSNKYVDTGAGFERICQIIQGVSSNYQTDLFMPLIIKISEMSKVPYSEDTGISHRVIADHIRCLCFALADGGFPSNEGRGYVLRRILRRAARYGRLLNFNHPFLYQLVDTVIDIMGHHYHELIEKKTFIQALIKAEEERFNQTLDKGLDRFQEIIDNLTSDTISGQDAFLLYDTYGFPFDLTKIITEEKGLKVDIDGFNNAMIEQQTRAREASNFKLDLKQINWFEIIKKTESVFVGYDTEKTKTFITRYAYLDDKTVCFQLLTTPFYAESGGQIADKGIVYNEKMKITVFNVIKEYDLFIHYGTLDYGLIDNSEVYAEVNHSIRMDIARNHTATHLLHKALRQIIGEHVQQKGSLVASDYLRFDFTHFEALTKAQIRQIEELINDIIRQNILVNVKIMPLVEARKNGAIALFGEKYTEQVRVIIIDEFSKELCGGTHVHSTGEIGMFKILSEISSAAGIRRIEAITGKKTESFVLNLQERLSIIAQKLNTQEKKIEEKIDTLIHQLENLKMEVNSFKQNQIQYIAEQLFTRAKQKDEVLILIEKVTTNSIDELRQIVDFLKNKSDSLIVALFSVIENKVTIIVSIGKKLIADFHAGKLADQMASFVGGKGGGKPNLAMAGGKDIDKIDYAITEAKKFFDL